MLLIFDYDGTLIDIDITFARLSTEILTKAGLKMSFEEMSGPLAGASSLDKITKAATNAHKTLTTKQADTIREEIRAAKKSLYQGKQVSLYPGVEDLFKRLQQSDVKYCIGSSNRIEKLNLNLAPSETNLGRFIPEDQRFCGGTLVDEGKIKAMKPDPGNFTYAADFNTIAYEDCFVIGDAVQDGMAAKACGMTFIGFKCPELAHKANIKDLYNAGAIQVFTSFKDLEQFLFQTISKKKHLKPSL